MAGAVRAASRAIRGRFGAVHVRHTWRDIEVVGHVHVQECSRCHRTRVRII
jgi:ribosomal protein L37AE/L43A